MANVTTERIRNFALLSHSGAGKTILTEAMLHAAGVTTRLGTVEDGTTVSDYEPEEHKRTTSVNTAIVNVPWKDSKLNVIDTPGYADYRGEVVSGVRVADAVVILVAAQAGIEVGTGQMWRLAEERNLPARGVRFQARPGEREFLRRCRGTPGEIRKASRASADSDRG